MANCKYIGKVYEGRWKIVESKIVYRRRYRYIAKNIFNGRTIEVSDRQLKKIDENKTSFSYIIRNIIFKEGKNDARTIVFSKRPRLY